MKFALNDKAKEFKVLPGDKLLFIFQKFDLSVFVDLEKNFSSNTLVVNFEVQKLHLCMYYCEVCCKL